MLLQRNLRILHVSIVSSANIPVTLPQPLLEHNTKILEFRLSQDFI
jgi:hypothetical protein